MRLFTSSSVLLSFLFSAPASSYSFRLSSSPVSSLLSFAVISSSLLRSVSSHRAAQRVYDERGFAAAYGPCQQEASLQRAFLPALTSIICAAMEMAISAGVSAFISSPMGVVMRLKSSSVKPCSRSCLCTPAVLALLPMTPI